MGIKLKVYIYIIKTQKLLVYLEKVVGKLKLIEYIVVDTMMIGYSYFDLIGMFQLVAIVSVNLNMFSFDYEF